jgi:glyceraldehyde 3-phosphate dehydrogenase
MKHIRVGLNGFGRIGRAFTRIALKQNTFSVSAINTRKTKPDMLAHLLQYDSLYGMFDQKVSSTDASVMINGHEIRTYRSDDPNTIPWDKDNIDVVVDCTGKFKTKETLSIHLKGSVKKVVLTAPPKDDTVPVVVLGVNDKQIDFAQETVFSNASCTTNCAAPLFKILNDTYGVSSGFLTTTHSYTSSQQLLDNNAKTFVLARSAGLNIIPTTTGAAKAIGKVIPDLKGKIDGLALRVPTPTVSFTDISAIVNKQITVDEINNLFKNATENEYKQILSYATVPLVSSDYRGSPYSAIFDPNYTKVMPNNLVKIFGWYDNEWGYSSRLVDLVEKLSEYV